MKIKPKKNNIMQDSRPTRCENKNVIVPTRRGPRKEVILPEKANNPKPFPTFSESSSSVIITLLALCMVPKNIETTITPKKNCILV